ncbi:MAG: winged helix-turn-helix transcriptional regulator [Halobacteriaceae archaeon]
MTAVRPRIAAYLTANPGTHVSGVVRDLDLARGQVQHHLDALVDAGAVVVERFRGRTHYFPAEYDPLERRRIAVVQRETARDVLVTLVQTGPTRPAVIADRLQIARSTLEYHLDALCDVDLVAKRRDEAGRVTLVVTAPETALDLVATTSPSTTDRFVDRFARLLDTFLED